VNMPNPRAHVGLPSLGGHRNNVRPLMQNVIAIKIPTLFMALIDTVALCSNPEGKPADCPAVQELVEPSG
jgi:hypothetical protein